MSNLHPYPEYQDSNVEWIGDIPASWSTRPFFSVVRENRRSNKGMIEDNLLSLSYGNIVKRDINSNEGLLPASFETYQIVEPNDVVLRLTDLQNDKRSLRSALATQRGIVTSAYLSVCPSGIDPRFLAYSLRAADLRKVFYSMGGGLRQSMKYHDMKWLKIALPPEREQQVIADYLDTESVQIERFITDQKRLITLMRERRSATITHAVTKGLDPNAPRKESGVTWLGQVPKTWRVHSGRRFFKPRNERARIGDKQLAATQEYGVIEQDRYTEITGNRVVSVLKGFDILKHVEPGDFVISMRSFQGGLEYSSVRGQISSAYVMLTPTGEVDEQYFRYLFKSSGYISALRSTSNLVRDGQAMKFSNFAQVPIAVPPLPEQRAIAIYLDEETAKIDAAIADAQAAITLSVERRGALISAAVTGKVDVRNWDTSKERVLESHGVA